MADVPVYPSMILDAENFNMLAARVAKMDTTEGGALDDKITALTGRVINIENELTTLNDALTSLQTLTGQHTNAISTQTTTLAEQADTILALTTNQGQILTWQEQHEETDYQRWMRYEATNTLVNDLMSAMQNKVKDTSNTVNIEAQAQSGGYTVNSSLGGVIDCSAVNILLSFGDLMVNGKTVWSTQGLTLAITAPIQHSEVVKDGDVITCSGMSSITFTPYVVDVQSSQALLDGVLRNMEIKAKPIYTDAETPVIAETLSVKTTKKKVTK